MNKVLFNIDEMSIKLLYKPNTLTYNRNEVKAEFYFTDEWQGVKTAIFDVDGKAYSVLIAEDNTCEIPGECYFGKSMSFKVGAICGDLKTTNWATVNHNESCYTPNATIPPPTEDVYNEIIKLLNEVETPTITDEQLSEAIENYFQDNPVEVKEQTSTTVIFKVNGNKTHWNSQDTSTCYKVDNVNQWNFTPCKLSSWVAKGNSNDISYYCSITSDGKGVQFADDITTKVKRISTAGNFFGQSQNWVGISLKLIASTLGTTDEEKKSDYTYLNDNIVAIFNDDLPAGNIKRHKSFVGIDFITEFEDKDNPSHQLIRDNMVLNCLMWSSSQDDYISDESYVMITFWDK